MSSTLSSETPPVTFEDTLEHMGWGCYQRISFAVCGFCAFVQAMATMGIFYVMPLSVCDHNISAQDIVFPISSYFCGLALGEYLLGSFADCVGRRAVVSTGLVTMFIGTMGCCFSTSAPMLIISSLIVGFGANCTTSAGKILLAEITPKSRRARSLVALDAFWTLGYTLGIVIYMYLMPSTMSELPSGKKHMRLRSWRVIMATGGIACIVQTTFIGLMCRSTRFLMTMHRNNEATDSLKHMYAVNNSKPIGAYEISNLDNIVGSTPLTSLPVLCLDILPHVTDIICQLSTGVMDKYRYQTLKCAGVYMLIFFEPIVLNVILAESLTSCAKQYSCFVGYKNFIQVEYISGKCMPIKQLPYDNLLLMSTAMLLGYLVLTLIIDWLRRPLMLMLLSFMASACYSVLATLQIYGLCYAATYLLVAVVCSLKSVFDIAVIEMFPTGVRGTANGMVKFVGHMTWCVMFLFLWTNCELFFVIQGCLMLVCVVAVCNLPDYRGKPMQEKL